VKVLYIEYNYNIRLIMEIIHIKEQENETNFKKDTEMLDGYYFNMKSHNVMCFIECFTYTIAFLI